MVRLYERWSILLDPSSLQGALRETIKRSCNLNMLPSTRSSNCVQYWIGKATESCRLIEEQIRHIYSRNTENSKNYAVFMIIYIYDKYFNAPYFYKWTINDFSLSWLNFKSLRSVNNMYIE